MRVQVLTTVEVVAVAAAGCAHRFERNMTEDLNKFVGKDIHAAIAELGYPAKEETIAGDHIFRWGINVVLLLWVRPTAYWG